jgi:hypothetical protein
MTIKESMKQLPPLEDFQEEHEVDDEEELLK